jgi:transcriptional repressor NrdR
LVVVKRSGVIEPFNRDKVITGVRKACKGRPVTEAQLARLGQRVEEALRASGQAEVATENIGIAILGPLSELDPVAYLRFASVYKNYGSADDFLDEIAQMRSSATKSAEERDDGLDPSDEQNCQPALAL